MHPFDGLFRGREVVDAIGMSQELLGLFGRFVRLPLATSLHQRYTVASLFVPRPDEDGGPFACDEYVLFLVYRHAIFCEY